MVASSGKIIALTAKNVKRLSAVHIKPGEDGCVLIGGKNKAGKTSCLDSIMYALGGASVLPDEPIRHGAESASIKLELGDLIVERKFNENGSTLKVSTKDGASYSSPQKILDSLFSRLTFDPLRFVNMKPDEQAATLRELVGIDTTMIDKRRAALYEERAAANRMLKEADADFARFPPIPGEDDLPENRPDADELIVRMRDAVKADQAHKDHESKIALLNGGASAEQRVAEAQAEVDGIDKASEDQSLSLLSRHDDERKQMEERHRREAQELAERQQQKRQAMESTLSTRQATLTSVKAEIEALSKLELPPRQDLEQLQIAIANVNGSADRWDRRKRRHDLQDVVVRRRKASDELTKQIEDCDKQKREKLAAAKYPIEGLGFSETGSVVFAGVPFSQAASSEQIRTSAAMGLAMNPQFRVLLIRDGSLLDDDGMKLMAEIAEEYDAQLWIERVGDRDESAIIIEDGHIRGVEPVLEDPKETKPKRSRKSKTASEDSSHASNDSPSSHQSDPTDQPDTESQADDEEPMSLFAKQ